MFALIETHLPTDDSGYSFHVSTVRGFETEREAETALDVRIDELAATENSRTGFNCGGRGGITVDGPAVDMADDCPVRVTLTVTEIQ